jgi:hypothetical protein
VCQPERSNPAKQKRDSRKEEDDQQIDELLALFLCVFVFRPFFVVFLLFLVALLLPLPCLWLWPVCFVWLVLGFGVAQVGGWFRTDYPGPRFGFIQLVLL